MKFLRIILTGFFIAGILASCRTGRNQLEFSTTDFKFDGPLGSAGMTIEKIAPNYFKVTLGHAPNHPDWNNKLQFQVAHAKGNSLKLHVVFPGGEAYRFNEYFHSWSYDGENWQPVHWQNHSTDSAAGDTLIFPVFTEDQVIVGHQVPLAYEDLQKLIHNWKKNSNVAVQILGQSLGGRDVYRVTVTDPGSPIPPASRVGHYFANQHPGEHNAQWRMVGMLNWLLSSAGAKYRTQSICHFVFMMSPDAPHHGWYRVNAQGIDQNRSYRVAGADATEQAYEAFLVQADFEKIMAERPVTTIWSMHTWGGRVEPILIPGPEFNPDRPWTNFREIIEQHDQPDLIEPLQVQTTTGNLTYWTHGPHQQFGISAILCEGGGDLYTQTENIQSGEILMQSIAEFYQPVSKL